ncbi:MAG: Betaine-aldehyde dehydrogenase [Ilumatobacteraceae bacterium]|nr:Betaine-aldehyde dehydrogenase [Ilumatobacteraceae bacterium]
MIEHDRLYIGGELVEPAGTGTIEIINPFTEEVAGRVPEGTNADIDHAVSAARTTFDTTDWSTRPVSERAAILARASAAIQGRMDELTQLISTEMGSPSGWGLFGQVLAPSMILDYYAGLGDTYAVEETRAGMFGPVLVRKEAMGVVGAIIPWNVPLFEAVMKVAPAVIAGCTVVLKPSPETALDPYAFAEIMEEAGLPKGVLSIVPGGREIGEYLVTHPLVDKITFTGSTAAGMKIGAACGALLRPVTLELGGKSAAIVLDDADLATVIPNLLDAGIMNNGQACVATTRILASRANYANVLDALTEAVAAMVVGDPLDPTTQVGPVVAERQRDRILGLLETGRNEGARVTTGGGRTSHEKGWFIEPTVFGDVDNKMTIAQEEIFGPVLSVIPFDDTADAVRIANDSPYGLGGSVWGGAEEATAIAKQVRTGTIQVNHFGMAFGAPFGGYKNSGLGRELGPEGVDAFMEKKALSLDPAAG